MKKVARHIFLAFALIWLSGTAQAQSFPTGTISVVVPLAPGDAADIAVRALGEEISRLLKTPVLVVNRPGVVSALGALSPHIKAGAVCGIVTSNRVPEFANIPTMRELGYQDELFGIWFSFLAPAGIPEDSRKALVGAIEQAVKLPAITARLAPLGIFQSYAGPEQMTTEIREEFKRVGELARRTGLVK